MCTSSLFARARASRHYGQDGQVTLLLVAVIALGATAAIALSMVGQAMVHRARARNAADAVALAVVIDPQAGQELTRWYREHNIMVEQHGSQTTARSGPSQAAAWASMQVSTRQPAPALVAIVARAEQLLGTTFRGVQWQAMAVTLSDHDAAAMRGIAAELGLCQADTTTAAAGMTMFEFC